MFDIAAIAEALAGVAQSVLLDKAQRSETVIKLLQRFGLSPDHPPSDFEAVYKYALVEYGVGKPKLAIAIFRQSEIQEIFRRALDANNPALLTREGDRFLQSHDLGDRLQEARVDVKREFYEFAAIFVKVANRTRTPAEVLTHQNIQSLRQQLAAVQDHLSRLPTLEGLRTELARLATEDHPMLPRSGEDVPQLSPVAASVAARSRAFALSQQIKGWFETLGYRFESYEAWDENSFAWILNIPVRRGRYDRIAIKGVDGVVNLADVYALRRLVDEQRTDEGWLVSARRIGEAARRESEKPENQDLGCYTFDELLDQDADFSNYLDGLERDIQARGIDRKYVPLACTKDEVDPATQHKLGTSRYEDIDAYIDLWLEDPAKEHISVLGEFGTGKTWFALHYAWQALQRYRAAQQKGKERPRLPLVIPLRDYAKAVSVESLFSEFFFRKHEIPIPGYSAFEQLNRMGKLLLIFDGFDEMAARVDRQAMVNNFWELAKAVVPGAKVMLTCRTEHFPEAREGRSLLNAELQASTKNLTGETPQFEVLELEKFDNNRIRQVLSLAAQPDTVERVMGNPSLLDLARRPVMTDLILEALPDIEAGKPIDMSRIYLYAVQRKMARDIKQERTFTSMADKLYFLCELSWEMLSSDRMKLNYKEFPDRIRQLFGEVVREQQDLDHWHYDMMGQTMLTRNAAGDYMPAHRSLLEFFVAYKLAAELGVLAEDFVAAAREQGCIDAGLAPQAYTWSAYFACEMEGSERKCIAPLQQFAGEAWSVLQRRWGQAIWAKAVMDLLVPMVRRDDSALRQLQGLLQETRGKSVEEVQYFGGNVMSLLAQTDPLGLQGLDLSEAILQGANLAGAWLQGLNLVKAKLTEATVMQSFGRPYTVTFSPDGTLLFTGHRDGDIRIWHLPDRQPLLAWKAHQDYVWSVSHSPNEQWIASGSGDRLVKVWSVINGECLHIFAGHKDRVRSVTYSPDGHYLASGSDDSTIKIWSVRSGECLDTLTGHQGFVRSVVFSPDGTKLASGSFDFTIKIWSLENGECLRTLIGHQNYVLSAAFSPDGKKVVSCSADSTIKVWCVASGECLKTLDLYQDVSWSVAYSTDGQYIASGNHEKTLKIWNSASGECLLRLVGHQDYVRFITYSSNGKELASCSGDDTVKIWNSVSGECLHTFAGHESGIQSLAYSPDGHKIVSGSDDNLVRIWDPSSKKCIQILEKHQNHVLSVTFSPNSQQIASCSSDHTIKIWSVVNGQCLHTLRDHDGRVHCVVYSPNGQRIATGSEDRTVKIWNAMSGQCLHTLRGHLRSIESVAYSPNGQYLATGSEDNTVKIWSAVNGECLHTLESHQEYVWSVAYSPDSQWIISGSHDCTVKIWNATSGECLHTLQGHRNPLRSVACSPDGQQVASGSLDQTVKIWSLTSGECLHTLQGNGGWIRSVAYSPDGSQLASGSHDGMIEIWDVATGQRIAVLDNRPYGQLDITGVTGLSNAQRVSMKSLGAIDNNAT